MGANIGTTLGNGLIALPLGPLGLLLGGIFALVHVFSKNERVKNIALACMGFALIFYGLNLMTGGLRPLRNMPAGDVGDLQPQGRQPPRRDLLRPDRGPHHGDDPLLVGDDRHRDGPRRRRRARLADRGRVLAGRRPRDDDHVVDGLAQPVEERQARRLRAHLVQHHRRRW